MRRTKTDSCDLGQRKKTRGGTTSRRKGRGGVQVTAMEGHLLGIGVQDAGATAVAAVGSYAWTKLVDLMADRRLFDRVR